MIRDAEGVEPEKAHSSGMRPLSRNGGPENMVVGGDTVGGHQQQGVGVDLIDPRTFPRPHADTTASSGAYVEPRAYLRVPGAVPPVRSSGMAGRDRHARNREISAFCYIFDGRPRSPTARSAAASQVETFALKTFTLIKEFIR